MSSQHNLRVAEDGTTPEIPKTSSKGARPTKVLPTRRITFSKQLDILRAYAAASGPGNKLVTLREVSDIVKMASGTVTIANPFFTDAKLLSRTEGMGLTPSPAVMEFARAFEWNRDTAAHKLAPPLSQMWFTEALLPRLAFGDLSEEEAITILAEKSSSPPDYKNQLRLILDFLEASGLIKREDGRVKAGSKASSASQPAAPEKGTVEHEDKKEHPSLSPTAGRVATAFTQPTQGVVNFHIDVRMDMTEFAGWTPDRIAAFFNGIALVLSAKAGVEKEVSSEE
jgi:hypothetical protein